MATLVEDARFKLQSTRKEREEFAAKVLAGDTAPTVEEEAKLEAMINAEADLKTELDRLVKFDAAKAGQIPGDSEQRNNPAKSFAKPRVITLGEQLVESELFKNALAAHAPGGKISSAGFNMPAWAFKGFADLDMKALITGDSSSSGGAFVVTDRQSEMITLGRRPLRIRDIVRNLQTTSDLVDYVAQLSRTNNAAVVAEATASGGSSGVKPESTFDFVVRQAPVKTIPTWIAVTKQAVADVPQMRGIIDTELKDDVEEVLETEMVTGSNFPGILQTSGRQSQAWDTNILTTTRKAKTKVTTVGRRFPNYYVLNPQEWEIIDLLQDNEARYYYGGPAQVGVARLWGLPVVESEAVTAGIGIVADFQRATLWDRMAATISMTDSHLDWFVRNMLAVLAELRAAFAVQQPNAFVEMDLTA